MAPPKSRRKLLDQLRAWAAGLTPDQLGVKGSIRYLPLSDTRSSVSIEVTDDQEREVIVFQITVREN